MNKKSIVRILSDEAIVQESARKAFALAVINEGLKPVPDDEDSLGRDTALESIAARLWLAAAQGDMKAIEMIRTTLDGPNTKDDSAAIQAGAAAGAAAAVLVSRLETSLLALRPGVTVIDANAMPVNSERAALGHDKRT